MDPAKLISAQAAAIAETANALDELADRLAALGDDGDSLLEEAARRLAARRRAEAATLMELVALVAPSIFLA